MEPGIRDSQLQSGKLIKINARLSSKKNLGTWKRTSLRIPIRWLNLMTIRALKLEKVSHVVIRMRRG